MPKTKFTTKKKNEILKKVLKKTNQYFEKSLRKKEKNEMDTFLEDEMKNI